MRRINPSRFAVATQRDEPRDQPQHRAEPGARAPAHFARRPGARHGRPPRRRHADRQRPARRGADLRGRHRRDGPRPQADVPLHRLAPPRRGRRRHPRQRDLRDAGRPARHADDRARSVFRRCATRRQLGRAPRRTRIKRLLADHPEVGACEGIGVVVPGMVEHSTMRVLHAPTLGWRNVDLRDAAGGGHRPAGAGRELGPRLRAGAGLGPCARTSAARAATWCSSASPTASASA